MAADFPRTLAAVQDGLSQRLHIGAQLYISRDRQILLDTALGEAQTGVPMTPETLMLWQSAGKPLTAVAIAQLWEQDRLQLDDPVARHIPEFAPHGKDAITIRHLLTHTAPLRGALLSNWDTLSWDRTIVRICAARPDPNWVPGRKAGYAAASTWFILGEIVQRLSRMPLAEYLRRHILSPLGLRDTHLCLTPDQYRAYGDRMGVLYNTEDSNNIRHNPYDTAEQAQHPRPGASLRGPIRDLGRFYEMLLALGQSDGQRLLLPQTVEAITARHRTAMLDQTFRHTMDWGLGFLLHSPMYGGDVPYGYPAAASLRTFGHGGAQSSTAFADPENHLVVAVLLNGTCGEVNHHLRMRPILTAVYEDLGLG